MFIRRLIMIALLLIGGHSHAADDPVLQLLHKSGIAHGISRFPQQLEEQLYHSQLFSQQPELEAHILNVMLTGYDYERALDIMQRRTRDILDPGTVARLLEWYDTPTAQRIAKAEMASAETGQAKLEAFFLALQTNPPAEQRRQLIEDYAAASRQTELLLALMKVITKGMIHTFNGLLPTDQRLSDQELNTTIDELMAQMGSEIEQLMSEQMLMFSHYIYRDISDEDLQQYTVFLRSRDGQHYLQLTYAIADVFSDIINQGIHRSDLMSALSIPLADLSR